MVEENFAAGEQHQGNTSELNLNLQSTSVQSATPLNKSVGSSEDLIKKIIFLLILLLIIAGIIVFGRGFWQSWQVKQRDSQRKADIKSLQKALETYRGKTKNQSYPAAITNYIMVKSGIMSKLPQDPINKEQYVYHYQSLPAICVADTCTSYVLFACLENKNDKEGINPVAPCTTKSYKVTSP